MNNRITVAVLLTCFNRKDLTISCLESLKKARSSYNKQKSSNLECSIFLTDDACTDGTSEAVKSCLKDEDLHIIYADGNAYWAGGMRLAWREAIKSGDFDFFLLLNDDTEVWDNLFEELFLAHEYCLRKYNKAGVYGGNTTWKTDHTKISFGGKKGNKSFFERYQRIYPNGTPQECDIVNANILMVAHSVVKTIGIFPDCYKHGAADNDYGLRANKAGFPVVVTGNFCGSCDADNYNYLEECVKISNMSLSQRSKYFAKPVNSIHDRYEFAKRWRRSLLPMILFSHFMLRYTPSLYAKLLKIAAK